MKELKDSEDELEQYCRGLCIKIDGVPMAEKKDIKRCFAKCYIDY